MLEEILNKYKSTKKKVIDEQLTKSNKFNNQNEIFINEDNCIDMKKKCDDIMSKYCTLYKDEADNKGIKPINHDFLNRKTKKLENSQTTGKMWFDMKQQILTPELKEDLKAIQLRGVIDPSRFYKKMDRKTLPKFFQVGVINDNIIEGKKYRLKKSEVRERIAEEFLQDDLAKNYSTRKFEEIQNKTKKMGLKKKRFTKNKIKSRDGGKKSNFITK